MLSYRDYETRRNGNHPNLLRYVIFCCIALVLLVGVAGAATTTWRGTNSVNWGTSQNWNNGVPGSTNNYVVLTGAGTNRPTNQNINSLSISCLTFDSTTNGFTVGGNTFTLSSSYGIADASGAGSNGISSGITLGSNQVWDIDSSNPFTVSGTVEDGSGTYSLTKTGPGTLILSSTSNGYDGNTAVNGGELQVNGQITSAPTVASGATLSGSGTITGSTTINSGGAIRGGTGSGDTGTLTISGTGSSLTFSSASSALNVTSDGTSLSLINRGTRSITAGSGLKVNLLDAVDSPGTYTLISSSTTLPTSTVTTGVNNSGYIATYQWVSGTGLQVTLSNPKISTTTAVGSSPNPSNYGQSVTYYANVSWASGSGTPTGTVSFYNNTISGSNLMGTDTSLVSNGTRTYVATITNSSLPAGSNTIYAVYSGDSNFETSTSSGYTQTVSLNPTTTWDGSSSHSWATSSNWMNNNIPSSTYNIVILLLTSYPPSSPNNLFS